MSAIERNPAASSGSEGPATLAARESVSDPSDFASADLSKEQVVVLRAIASGKSICAAAREAGVNRCTVHRWQHDPRFQHWLQAWKSQTTESGRNIMLTLIERSARVLERALDKDDVRVALTLLTKLGVLAAKDEPALGAIEEPVLNHVEGLVPTGQLQDSAPVLPNPKPKTLKELRGIINEVETKFGDMLPGGRR